MKSTVRIIAAVISLLSISAAVSAEVEACPSSSSDDYYFRPGTFERKDDFVRRWYSQQLRAMNEPSMWCGSTADTEYRFTWLRTFHHPIAVRVTSNNNVARIEAVELDGTGGYDPGKELRRVLRPMSREDWLSIHHAMDAWAPTESQKTLGTDGSMWIFEQRTAQGYRAIEVWSPTSGPARTVGELFLVKAGIAVPLKENY